MITRRYIGYTQHKRQLQIGLLRLWSIQVPVIVAQLMNFYLEISLRVQKLTAEKNSTKVILN